MTKNIYILIFNVFLVVTLHSQIVVQEIEPINTINMHCSPHFASLNNKLFFNASKVTEAYNLQPWICTNENACAKEFIRVNSGSSSGLYANPYFLSVVNNKMFFTAYDSTHGNCLWTTDGTVSGTNQLVIPNKRDYVNQPSCACGSCPTYYYPSYSAFNNKFYFTGIDSAHGEDLWVSDGTIAGTQLLKDVDPTIYGSGFGASSYPQNFVTANNKLFFMAYHTDYGRELWVTDGTAAGTQLTKNVGPYTRSSLLHTGIAFNNKIYIPMDDSIHGKELWSSDGTNAGTNLVFDVNAGLTGSDAQIAYSYKGKLYFTANDGTNGLELWVSDSITNITSLLKDITSFGSSSFSNFTPYNNKLYFLNNNTELWSTDGTNAGTILVKNGLAYASDLIVFAGKIYFYNNGFLWNSDGTTLGTVAVSTINNGFQPRHIINNKLVGYNSSLSAKFWICDSLNQIDSLIAPGVTIFYATYQLDNVIYFEGYNSIDNHFALFRIGDTLAPCDFTGINNQLIEGISIYPNPTSSIINIDLGELAPEKTSIIITNLFGQKLFEKSICTNNIENIHIPNLSNGTYFVKIVNMDKLFTSSFIKQN